MNSTRENYPPSAEDATNIGRDSSALDSVPAALQFAGALIFGGCIAVMLHELGHATGVWLVGGEVHAFILHPFLFSGSTLSWDVPEGQWHFQAVGWGGVGFGTVYAAVVFYLTKKWIGDPMIQMLGWSIGLMGFIANGLYFVVGSVLPFGDAWFLVGLGVSQMTLLCVGLPLTATSFYLFDQMHRVVGLTHRDPLRTWMFVMQVPVAVYYAICAGYQVVFPDTWFKHREVNWLFWLIGLSVALSLITYHRYWREQKRNELPSS